MPALSEPSLTEFPLGADACALQLDVAPRLSALRLEDCRMSEDEAAGLEARLREVAGRCTSLELCAGPVPSA